MLHGKLNMLSIQMDTKATQDELDLVKRNAVNENQMKVLDDKIKALEYQLFQLEGEDNENDESANSSIMDGIDSANSSSQAQKRNIYGFGDDYWNLLMREKAAGSNLGMKKFLKYH